jgi:hypothetical protein
MQSARRQTSNLEFVLTYKLPLPSLAKERMPVTVHVVVSASFAGRRPRATCTLPLHLSVFYRITLRAAAAAPSSLHSWERPSSPEIPAASSRGTSSSVSMTCRLKLASRTLPDNRSQHVYHDFLTSNHDGPLLTAGPPHSRGHLIMTQGVQTFGYWYRGRLMYQ